MRKAGFIFLANDNVIHCRCVCKFGLKLQNRRKFTLHVGLFMYYNIQINNYGESEVNVREWLL